MSSVRLDGKVAVITGTTAGIGKAIAVDMARRGVAIVGTGRRAEPAESLAEEIAALGGSFTFVQGDVANWADCEKTVARALEVHGKINILINNAGTALPLRRFDEISEDDWRAVSGVNLDGSLFMSRLCLPVMQEQRDGVILFIASGAGVLAMSRNTAYSITKAAVIHMANVIAVENVNNGVRANALVVGAVPTPLLEKVTLETGRQVHGPDWVPTPPDPETYGQGLGRAAISADQVANAIAVLCTDEARELTGGTIPIDRGYKAGLYTSMLIEYATAGLVPM